MKKLLIANRGEIAVRIMRTCQQLGISTVAIYSEADRDSLHVATADEAFLVGPARVEHSYLNIEKILAAARHSGADAIHPGYGFLSENAGFAEAVKQAGYTWVGPPVSAMRAMASKIGARDIAMAHAVPVIPALTLTADESFNGGEIVSSIGLPLLVKSSAGGGGIGMREVHEQAALDAAIDEARQHGLRQFGSADLLIEKFIPGGRHVEVQVVGDQQGKLLHLYERDCSAQRRRQKLLEEAPVPGLPEALSGALHDAAIRLAGAINYHGVGTVEFLLNGDEFYLLEMNTRLQIEHGVTETVCDLDLVALQLSIAQGQPLALEQQDIRCRGHAIEARIYAENPGEGFRPASGTISAFSAPAEPWLRVDSGVVSGSEVGHHYDGLLCKLIVHGEDREQASIRMRTALNGLQVAGVDSNQQFLRGVVESPLWAGCLSGTTIEAKIADFVEAATPTSRTTDLALIAATIWQFSRYPPAADRQPWPGGYKRHRQASFSVAGKRRDIVWRWAATGEFEFPDLSLSARLIAGEENLSSLNLQVDNQRVNFEIHRRGDTLWLWQPALGNLAMGIVHTSDSNHAGANSGQCKSPGPGLVLRILVGENQIVAAGEPLLVIESMKMEGTLNAPRAGQIAEILVTEGELVAAEQLLLRLEDRREETT